MTPRATRIPQRRALTFLTAGLAALALFGCTSAADVALAPPEKPAIDAESYYENYDESDHDDYGSMPSSIPDASTEGGTGDPTGPEDPGLLDDNTFVDAGTDGAVDPAVDPLSTFALDVDTGSYSVGRTLLSEGMLPPPESIRVEEWVNAYDYNQDAPIDQDLGISVEQAVSPSTSDGTQLVKVGVKARDVTDAERPPVAVTLVVDTSGSMNIRERLGLVKSSLALLAEHLKPTDTIAVVTYEDSARPVLEPTPVADTEAILDAIDELRPGGGTNLEAGMLLGYRQAREAYQPDAINAVILASDGVANIGTTGPDKLADMIRSEGEQGIHLVTVGYGMGNYNDDLMEQLADQGDGFYAYVDTFDEARKLFVEDLNSTLTPVAQDAKVQVEFDPAVVSSYRLIGYENRAIEDDDFADATVDAGEIGADHDVTALYEVTLVEATTDGQPIGTVDLRWESAEDGSPEQATHELAAAPGDAAAGDEFLLAATVADLAQLLKQAEPVGDREVDLGVLAERADQLEASGVEGADELSDLIALASVAR